MEGAGDLDAAEGCRRAGASQPSRSDLARDDRNYRQRSVSFVSGRRGPDLVGLQTLHYSREPSLEVAETMPTGTRLRGFDAAADAQANLGGSACEKLPAVGPYPSATGGLCEQLSELIYLFRPARFTLNIEARAMAAARIVSDPTVMLGKPVIEGTRITVEFVLEELAAGQTVEALTESHPTITMDGVRAALDYAAKVLKSEIVYTLEVG